MSKTSDDKMLDKLQHDTFQYFLHESNPRNGLVMPGALQIWSMPSCPSPTAVGR